MGNIGEPKRIVEIPKPNEQPVEPAQVPEPVKEPIKEPVGSK